MLKSLLVLLTLGAAAPLAAQTASPIPTPATVRVALETSAGRIVLELERAKAPITAGNFLRYVDQHRLDGTVFYRGVAVQPDFGFVQFGVENAPKRVLPPIAHEPTTQTGIKHLSGTISTARLAPGTAQGEFTISVGDQPSFDADPSKPGDNLGYAAFGHVVEGMDVVKAIMNDPKSSDKGPFKGEMLDPTIKIISAHRVG